jgi:hypothetical protein
MPSQPSQTEDPHQRTLLLGETVELLRWELSVISNRQWEDLPELKKNKVVLASRLREIDWTSGPVDLAPADWFLLKSQISILEDQSRQKIEDHIQLIGNQILALQEQHQYWRECLNVSFRKLYESIPSP